MGSKNPQLDGLSKRQLDGALRCKVSVSELEKREKKIEKKRCHNNVSKTRFGRGRPMERCIYSYTALLFLEQTIEKSAVVRLDFPRVRGVSNCVLFFVFAVGVLFKKNLVIIQTNSTLINPVVFLSPT